MANANTVSAVYNLTAAVTSTTETAFSQPNPIGGSSSSLFPVSTTRAIVEANSGIFDGRPFRVRVAGKATVGASLNTTIKVYWNIGNNTNLTTFTGDVAVASTGTMASGAAASFSFYDSAIVLWDSTSGRIASYPEAGGLANIPTTFTVLQATAVVSNSGTPLASSITLPSSLQFFATVTFGTANASNTVTLTELAIDQI